ncbi:hypothetical protein SKZB199_0457 [Streptococcus sp. ZB199]|nr:hypothetical protein SKZB199_0457 [Streptococcus sp. ZB199]
MVKKGAYAVKKETRPNEYVITIIRHLAPSKQFLLLFIEDCSSLFLCRLQGSNL